MPTSVTTHPASDKCWRPFPPSPTRPVRCTDGFSRPAGNCIKTDAGWVPARQSEAPEAT